VGGEVDGRKDGWREEAILLGASNGGASDYRMRQGP